MEIRLFRNKAREAEEAAAIIEHPRFDDLQDVHLGLKRIIGSDQLETPLGLKALERQTDKWADLMDEIARDTGARKKSFGRVLEDRVP